MLLINEKQDSQGGFVQSPLGWAGFDLNSLSNSCIR